MSRVLAGHPLRLAPDSTGNMASSTRSNQSSVTITSDSPPSTHGRPASSTTCFLLKLPAELRNRVYELVLLLEAAADGRVYLRKRPTSSTDEKHSVVVRRWPDAKKNSKCFSGKWVEEVIEYALSRLSILQTCSQINNEACALFYSLNHLAVPITGLVKAPRGATVVPPGKQFFKITSDARLSGITRLTILIGRLQEVCLFCKQAKTLINLRYLTIVVYECHMDSTFDEAAARDGDEIEKALRKLSADVRVVWEMNAEGKQQRLDDFVIMLEERKQKAELAKQKRLKR